MDVIKENLEYTAPPVEIADPHGRLADMIASRQFPGWKVADGQDAFFQHRGNHQDLDKLTPCLRDVLLDEAKKKNVSIAGKIYVDGLAQYPNDPTGWCSDVSEMKAKAQAQNKHLTGAVNFHPDPRKTEA